MWRPRRIRYARRPPTNAIRIFEKQPLTRTAAGLPLPQEREREKSALAQGGEERRYTTLALRSAAISAAARPSSSARISSVCSPSMGGGRRTEVGVAENL